MHCRGDLMLDTYRFGHATRISPEAPVPVLMVDEVIHKIGGAGNLALNLDALGLDVTLIAMVGEDDAGECLRELFREQAPKIKLKLHVEEKQPTTQKIRFIADGQQLLREDREAHFASDTVSTKMLNDILVETTEALLISDYDKGFVANSIAPIISLAKTYNTKIFIDPKKAEIDSYRGVDVLKPNELEFSNLFNLKPADLEDPNTIFERLTKFGIEKLFVTRGSKGITYFDFKGKRSNTIPAVQTSVFDVTGAGDTALAALVYAQLHGLSDDDSCQLANQASASVVSRIGTSVLSLDDLAIGSTKAISSEVYRSQDEILSLVGKWKSEKVVFVNGCFDLLHPGHVHLLNTARRLGTKLVIAINSDSSVKNQNKIYGYLRPIDDISVRISKIQALKIAEAIIVFDDPTSERILTLIKPNMVVKGSDYKGKHLEELKIIEENGGAIYFTDLLDDFSTSSMISMILEDKK